MIIFAKVCISIHCKDFITQNVQPAGNSSYGWVWNHKKKPAFQDTTTSFVSLHVISTNVLISHKSFTYFTPGVFSTLCNILIISGFRKIVRVSFSAPNASQQCGAFLFVGAGMGDGISALDLDASDACTDVFLQGQSLVRISREMGLQSELARDAYKKPDLKRVRVVRL